MTQGSLRCVFSGALPPALNMGIDEALLHGSGATLRLYHWSPPGVSLGYFQRHAEFAPSPRHRMVRRITGGGAIDHDGDLTFALTVDAARLPAAIADSYAAIHAALARALGAVGVPVICDGACQPRPRPDVLWCLSDCGPHDVRTAAGRKIIGSAQRRVRRPTARVLHHGSLVLTPPAATPECGAVSHYADAAAVAADLRAAIVREVAAALDLRLETGTLERPELERAQRLAAQRYGADAFTRKR
jgi:lipoate-protein ligase A